MQKVRTGLLAENSVHGEAVLSFSLARSLALYFSLFLYLSLPRYPTSRDHRPRISPGRDCRESEAAVRTRRDDDHDARGDPTQVTDAVFTTQLSRFMRALRISANVLVRLARPDGRASKRANERASEQSGERR